LIRDVNFGESMDCSRWKFVIHCDPTVLASGLGLYSVKVAAAHSRHATQLPQSGVHRVSPCQIRAQSVPQAIRARRTILGIIDLKDDVRQENRWSFAPAVGAAMLTLTTDCDGEDVELQHVSRSSAGEERRGGSAKNPGADGALSPIMLVERHSE
jgi:hypothetical protein